MAAQVRLAHSRGPGSRFTIEANAADYAGDLQQFQPQKRYKENVFQKGFNSILIISTDFLQQVDCMTYQVKLTTEYRSRCVRRLQGDFETVSAHYYRPKSGQSWAQHLSSYLRGACCAYNAWENCIVGMLTDQCGPSSGAIFRRFIKHLGMYLWDGFCPMERFNPMESTGDQCPPGIYQSPSDFEPMGVRSLSLFSRYFAYACPNAAYGIV